MRHRSASLFLIAIACMGLCACTAQYALNPKLGEIHQRHGIKEQLVSPDRNDQILLVLTFSGGGIRAASLAYGVLETLDRIDVPPPVTAPPGRRHTLLDEVDVIASVSGGSFTASYYGLYGKGIFNDFRSRFLMENHQVSLLWGLVNPLNWFRLWSPRFGRSDMAQDYYDMILYERRTLGDMNKPDRPFVMILATDAINGLTFGFTPSQFGLICSDYDRFPVARAVTASAAYPGVFTPIILRNYAGQCDARIPAWIPQALVKPDWTSRAYHMATNLNSYLDTKSNPYIHLLDGGISDNLGLRSIVETMAIRGGIRESLKDVGLGKARRVAFIIVDAQTRERPRWRLLDEIPGLAAILGASSTIMINKYNFETIDLLRRYIQEWSAEDVGAGLPPIEFYVIHVGFDYLAEKEERDAYQEIPTTMYLPPEQVDLLRDAAGRILFESQPFQKLVRDLGGTFSTPVPVAKGLPGKAMEEIKPKDPPWERALTP